MQKERESTVILIVDDNDLVRQTLSEMLESLEYKWLVASNGQEATEILASNPCDIVLSDIVMPVMDGMELLKYIRNNHLNTDVIIATGFSERFSYADVIKAGAIDFIKKPFDRLELEAKLERALRERKIMRKLEQLSMCDSLTNLLNRRAFDSRFAKEVERADRQKYPLFLAIIDIDNFKEYNDLNGHQAGDKVLVNLAQIITECTRNSVDLCFRLGGDEFAVILPQTSAEQAQEISQRILQRFMEKEFGSTGLSIGISPCERNYNLTLLEDEEKMKERADQAMYKAKKCGKKQIYFRD